MAKRKLRLFVCALMLYVIFIAPVFFHWPDEIRACALLLIMQILWLGRIFSLAYSSVLLMVILGFHFMSYEKVLGYVASPVVWLLFSMYLLSGAFIRSGLAHRLSLQILYWSKGSGRKIVGASFFLMSILSVMIPSNIGRGNLVTSILDKMVINVRQVEEMNRLPKALFISVCYVTALTGALLATGASSTIYTFGFINDHLVHPLTFLQWMLFTVPPVIVFMVLLWLVLNVFFPLGKTDAGFVTSFIKDELAKAGQVKKAEIKMVLIIAGTVLLWVLEPLHHYSIPLIGLLGAVATIFPGVGVWKWEEARQKINWDTILFFASTLMLSNVLISSGLLKWISSHIALLVGNSHVAWLLLLFILFIFVIRLFFVNVLGVMAFIIPLSFSIGEQFPGISPVLFPLTFFLAGVPGFFFITQSPVHMISFSYGYFSEKDLLKTGVIASAIWLVILLATAFFYWDGLLLG
jgi:anion transporter